MSRLKDVIALLDHHDGLTLSAGNLYSALSFDLATSEHPAMIEIEALIAQTCAAAEIPMSLLPLSPPQASDAHILNLITRMLIADVPHAWDLYQAGEGWFAQARLVMTNKRFSTDAATRTVTSPQAVPLVLPPKRILAHLAKAARRAQDHCAALQSVPSPQSNVITQLLLAGGERPHLSDSMVSTAASLRSNDKDQLIGAAGHSVCPLCRKGIKSHHPLLCDTILHRGKAHDNLVRRLATQTSKNLSLSVRANKAHIGPNGKEGRFRPDIAIEETSQLFEIKTLNAEAHGPRLHQDFNLVASEARAKYLRHVDRVPLIISASTDGFAPRESFLALEQLTNSANLDMPIVGPRLMLIAGLALCESAAGAYEAWYSEVRSAPPLRPIGRA